MEYATEICNDQHLKHVGYSDHICTTDCNQVCTQKLHSKQNIHEMSRKITELLTGVDKNNRSIIVPDKTICSVMSSVYENFRPETSDIFSRYNIPQNRPPNYNQRMIDDVINIITSDVKNNLGMIEANEKLTIWTTVLGDFNEHGLRSHPPIKLRERRPMPMAFNLNY